MKHITVAIAIVLSLLTATPGWPKDLKPVKEEAPKALIPGDFFFETTNEAVVFSHKTHVEDIGLTCDACHTAVFEAKLGMGLKKGDYNMNGFYDGKYCGFCHNGEKAFSLSDFEQCATCHMGKGKAQNVGQQCKGPDEAIVLGTEDSVVHFKHSAHASFQCMKCHTRLFPMKKTGTITTMDDVNQGKACGACHNGKAAFDAGQCGKCHPKM